MMFSLHLKNVYKTLNFVFVRSKTWPGNQSIHIIKPLEQEQYMLVKIWHVIHCEHFCFWYGSFTFEKLFVAFLKHICAYWALHEWIFVLVMLSSHDLSSKIHSILPFLIQSYSQAFLLLKFFSELAVASNHHCCTNAPLSGFYSLHA